MSGTHLGLTERTFVGLAWTSLAMGAQALMQLVALVLLARLLPPSKFGVFAAGLIVVGFCTIFSELGVGSAIVQRPVVEPRHIRVGFTLSVLLSCIMGVAVWATAPAIAWFFQVPELTEVVRGVSVGFPLQGAAMVSQALAQRELRFRWLAGIDAGTFTAGFVIVAPILALFGFGVWALVGAHLIQQSSRTIILLIGQPHVKRPLLEKRAIGELLYFGGGFTLARLANYLAGQGDNLVVGRWLGPLALGLYSHAYQLMAAPAMLVGQVLDRVLFPTMALVQREPQRLTRAYQSGISACALLILPLSAVIGIVADEIVLVLLGPPWSGVILPLRILALGMLFRTSYKLSDTIARATGAVYARAWRQAVFAAAVLLGSLVGQLWGLGGVALGVLAAICINFVLMAHLSLCLTGLRWSEFARAHLPGAVLGALVGVGAWVLVSWLRAQQTSPVMILLGVALLTLLVSLMLFWLVPSFFLGRHVQPLVRALTALMPAKLQRRSI